MNQYQSKWENGEATEVSEIFNLALNKYNNLNAQKEWVLRPYMNSSKKKSYLA